VAGVVHLLAPDCIVLGGGLVEAMPKLYVKEVSAGARKSLLPAFVDSFKVVTAELGDVATAMGAAAWVREVAVEPVPTKT
jgi:glucokinase